MRKGLKNLIIGALILGSFCTQAGRTALGRPIPPAPTLPFGRYEPIRSNFELKQSLGFGVFPNGYFDNDHPIFKKAHEIVSAKDITVTTMETLIMREIFYHQKLQIVLSEEWSNNGARENVIKFLESLIDLKHLPLSKAFDIALMRVGKAIPTNVNTTMQAMWYHAQEGTLFKFFSNYSSTAASLKAAYDESLMKTGLADQQNLPSR